MRHELLAPLVVLAAAVGYGLLLANGPGAALAFVLLGLLGGALMRSWRALPLLAFGLLIGASVRIARDAPWLFDDLRFDGVTIRFLGKGAFGLLLGYGILTLLLTLPVAAGRWLATPRPPRTLRTWRS